MTDRERAIPGINFETVIDRQIREAQERGAFDDLPGAGKPIKGLDQPHDELWWVKQLMEREQVSFTPPVLALRKAVEEIDDLVAGERTEAGVRRLVRELDEQVVAMIRNPPAGPSISVRRPDVEQVVARWRAQRRG